MITLLMLLLSAPAEAAQLAGVDMPDTATVGGQSLVLNGMGLREKYFIDVYVGGLYLPNPTTSSDQAIESDVPKRLEMVFVYKTVTAAQQGEAFIEGLEKLPKGPSVKEEMKRLVSWLPDVHTGDKMVLDYVPGKGTTLSVNDTYKGTIPGVDFMQVLWGIYIGPAPPTAKLKRGLMGG